jgi:hypothetical protein
MSAFSLYKDRIAAFLYILVCLFLICPCSLVIRPFGELDGSWQIALSLAAKNRLTFGTEFIFTFGPLGFLCTKYTLAHSKYWMLLFDAFVLFCSGVVIRHFLQVYQRWRVRLLLLPVALALHMGSLIHLLVPLYLYFTLHYAANRKPYPLILSSILVCLSFYIKVNYGIVLAAIQCFAMICFIFLRQEQRMQLVGICIFQVFLLYAPAAFLNVSLPDYVVGSFHLISAYNEAMYLPYAWTRLKFLLALGLIMLFFVLCWRTRQDWMRSPAGITAIVLSALYLFLIFKNGFVRADNGHINEFFRLSFFPFIFSFYYFNAETAKRYFWVFPCVIVLVFGALAKTNNDRLVLKAELASIGRFNYVREVFSDTRDTGVLRSEPAPRVRIKPYQTSIIGTSNVDIIPWEISEIFVNHLNYNPRPVIQSYSAYDRYLDQKNADKYSSASAPDFLLFSLMTIDDRYAFWDESITRRTMLSNYELIADNLPGIGQKRKEKCFDNAYYLAKNPDLAPAIAEGKYVSAYDQYQKAGKRWYRPACEEYEVVLLKKRVKPLEAKVIQRQAVQLALNKEFRVKESDALLYLYANVRYTWVGELLRIFIQPPSLKAKLKFGDGTEESYSAVVPIVKTGILINKQVTTTAEAADFFFNQGRGSKRIAGVTFEAPFGFEKTIGAELEEVIFL